MELKDTVELMNSDNYKDRFIAEYQQLKIRTENPEKILIKLQAGTLEFQPECSIELLGEQHRCMVSYLSCLKIRAEIEHIDLED